MRAPPPPPTKVYIESQESSFQDLYPTSLRPRVRTPGLLPQTQGSRLQSSTLRPRGQGPRTHPSDPGDLASSLLPRTGVQFPDLLPQTQKSEHKDPPSQKPGILALGSFQLVPVDQVFIFLSPQTQGSRPPAQRTPSLIASSIQTALATVEFWLLPNGSNIMCRSGEGKRAGLSGYKFWSFCIHPKSPGCPVSWGSTGRRTQAPG
ncbi:Hypothetical predicted protein [Marmota monax]|uniref:Uncharacterized protein n=1 Tax=Marmota monax TaxID=9995 RepID=A0A5E4BCL6_MARMO|nr:hypothetical protein GHT09_008379 [Marmota monax]VTJ66700.1 Hypothetical predicted protein [Marmota monax]